MSAKIIEPHRYKKTTRKKVEKAKLAKKNNLKYKKYINNIKVKKKICINKYKNYIINF